MLKEAHIEIQGLWDLSVFLHTSPKGQGCSASRDGVAIFRGRQTWGLLRTLPLAPVDAV